MSRHVVEDSKIGRYVKWWWIFIDISESLIRDIPICIVEKLQFTRKLFRWLHVLKIYDILSIILAMMKNFSMASSANRRPTQILLQFSTAMLYKTFFGGPFVAENHRHLKSTIISGGLGYHKFLRWSWPPKNYLKLLLNGAMGVAPFISPKPKIELCSGTSGWRWTLATTSIKMYDSSFFCNLSCKSKVCLNIFSFKLIFLNFTY